MIGGHLSIPGEIYAEALRQDRDAEELYRMIEQKERRAVHRPASGEKIASVTARTTDPQGSKE